MDDHRRTQLARLRENPAEVDLLTKEISSKIPFLSNKIYAANPDILIDGHYNNGNFVTFADQATMDEYLEKGIKVNDTTYHFKKRKKQLTSFVVVYDNLRSFFSPELVVAEINKILTLPTPKITAHTVSNGAPSGKGSLLYLISDEDASQAAGVIPGNITVHGIPVRLRCPNFPLVKTKNCYYCHLEHSRQECTKAPPCKHCSDRSHHSKICPSIQPRNQEDQTPVPVPTTTQANTASSVMQEEQHSQEDTLETEKPSSPVSRKHTYPSSNSTSPQTSNKKQRRDDNDDDVNDTDTQGAIPTASAIPISNNPYDILTLPSNEPDPASDTGPPNYDL